MHACKSAACLAHHFEHAAPRHAVVVRALRLPGLAALAEARPARVTPVYVVVGILHQLQLASSNLNSQNSSSSSSSRRTLSPDC
jgi:hypothetical protein